MKLPIPIQADGSLYTDVKLRDAEALTVAKSKELASGGDYYGSVLEWNAGVTAEISGPDGEITDTTEIRRLLRMMPFQSAYALACFGMAQTKGDDSIPGVYACPKCGREIRCERGERDGDEFDECDHLWNLEMPTLNDPSGGISISLSSPVELRKKDAENTLIETVETFTLEWPTLAMCMKAHARYPDNDSQMQLALYADALRDTNGKPHDGSWKTVIGIKLFEQMKMNDNRKIDKELQKYSINMEVERACMKCKTRWKAPLDLNGFFASGLGR